VIEYITELHHDAYEPLIASPTLFSRELARARNRLDHGKGLALHAQDAFNLVRAAEYVVAAVLAAQLGFSDSEILDALRGSYRFNALTQVCKAAVWGSS